MISMTSSAKSKPLSQARRLEEGRLSNEARDFLHNEARHLQTHSSAAARRLLESIREAKRKLSDFPFMGSIDEDYLVPPSRRLVVGEYVLTYDVAGDTESITSIWHGRMGAHVRDIDEDVDFEA